ncbi:hypothetical protein M406DRAFT_331468 [Cryphonectria parasitica EP155]|uniref:ATPase dynein-related AAA domain-containing protein n=1 Tax=Cryphonectria parasitica (strain ATCC 38755 / EP155) TaxID=660469 RepID=A0A9P5CPG7_CRYP1|nr:uncharacterized protein M406DRAFT_331468 [Cryphonectria parasitica EP155]KAF3765156.1 hypothetical protein M406DRAFT_331468 [Cryphonectria parasitica EP155]
MHAKNEWDFQLPKFPRPSPEALANAAEDLDLRVLLGAVQHGWTARLISNHLDRFDPERLREAFNSPVEGVPSMFYSVSTNNEAILSGKKQMKNAPDESKDPDPDWFTKGVKNKLMQTINLTQQYYLAKADKLKRPSLRQKQVASRRNAEPLLGIPYFLVGQSLASSRLLKKFLTNLAKGNNQGSKPLVLAFAGPSGHGKTELARRLGYLLSLELEVVDCTTVTREIELFGPRDYRDRRNLNKVDCSQTIFILGTNAINRDIQDFCSDNQAIFSEDPELQDKAARDLSKIIKDGFRTRFDVREPVRLTADTDEQLLGDVHLRVPRDGAVCRALAEASYDAHLGARSLQSAVEQIVHRLKVE